MTSTASVIGNKFVLKYYTILSESPESLWHFFKNLSEFTYGSEGDNLPDDTVVGAENISHKIESSDFKDCKVTLSVVDCHDSINGSVLVVVIGWLSNKGETPRKFVQTFLLAVQTPAGYYVHNSVFRYLKETSPFLPNPNQPQPPHQVQSSETKPEKEPEVVPQEKPAPVPQPEPVKVEEPKPAPPKVEEVKIEEPKKVEEAPAPAPVVEKVIEKPVEPPKKPEHKEEKQSHPHRPSKKEKEAQVKQGATQSEEKNQPKGWAAIVTKTASSKSEPQQPPAQAPKPKATQPKSQAPKESQPAKEAPKETNNHSEAKVAENSEAKPEKKAPKSATATSGYLPLEENLTVFVSNIPFQASEEQVRECFKQAGEVRSIVLRAQQGYCFVEFGNAEVVQKAIQFAKATQFILDGRVLSLEEKKPNSETGGNGGNGGGWKKESFKKDFKKKPLGYKNNGNGKPKEYKDKDYNNKPKKPFLKEGIVSQ